MNIRNLSFMTIAVLAAMALLLAINLSTLFTPPPVEKFLSFNGVAGIAVEHEKTLYTLNFDQQNHVIAFINESLPIGEYPVEASKTPLNVSKLIIYRFEKPNITLNLVTYDKNDLILKSTEWNPQGFLKDISQGSFKTLLSETYDS